jgi:DNA-directed RNA polymerase subunit RPC12/RpoP
MLDIKFSCPHCQQDIEAPEDMIGMSAKCPTCHKKIQVPTNNQALAKSSTSLPNSSDNATACTATLSQQRAGDVVLSEAKCRNCGAQVSFDANKQLVKCAFCGSEYAIGAFAPQNAVAPNLPQTQIVPIAIDEHEANKIFLKWLSEGSWKPNDLVHAFKKNGSTMVYVPFWLFNADVRTTWNGFYGQTQYRPVTKTRFVNGREQRYVDNEPYTVWCPQSGEHAGNYSDFISASGALSQKETDKLRFDAKDFKPLRNEYLQGWQSEKPSVTEGQAAEKAQQRMIQREGNACRQLTDRLQNWCCQFTFRNSCVVYLPVWTFAYRYGNASYRAIINGRTGDIFGKKPVSPIKIIMAIVAVLALVGIGFAVYMNSEQSPAEPQPAGASSAETSQLRPNESTPPPQRGSTFVIQAPTNLYFRNQVFRVAQPGEEFQVYEYRPNEKKLYILSKDANGNPIGLNIPDQ